VRLPHLLNMENLLTLRGKGKDILTQSTNDEVAGGFIEDRERHE